MTRQETLAEGITDQWVTIYALCEPVNRWKTGEVRYVGKTVRTVWHRVRAHCYGAQKPSARLPVLRWLKKQIDAGNPLHIIHLERVPPGHDWAARERFWIAKYRSEGARLLNLTEGGEGLSGLQMSELHKKRISESLKTGSTFACERCGQAFWRKRSAISRGHNRFCSRACSNRRAAR